MVNSLTLFALSILLSKTVWGLFANVTTIEGWEIERHEAVLRRARAMGGYLFGADGEEIRIERQEFPWDIGFLKNICQAMGTWNPVMWVLPFAPSPSLESGLVFEHNGIEGEMLSLHSIPSDDLSRSQQAMAASRSGQNVPSTKKTLWRWLHPTDGH